MLKKNFTAIFLLLLFLIPCHSPVFAEQKTQARTVRESGNITIKVTALASANNKFTDDTIESFEKTCDSCKVKRIDAFTKDELNTFTLKDNIVAQIRESAPDLILAIGDDAVALLKNTDDIPIYYVYGTDISERISKKNITGLKKTMKPEEYLHVIRQILGAGKKHVGIIYEADKADTFIEKAKTAAKENSITLVPARLTTPYRLTQENEKSLLKMLKSADAVWMMPDSGTAQVRAYVSYQCIKSRLYIISFSENMVDGELVSVSPDPADTGIQAATAVMAMLSSKEEPGNIPKAHLRKGNITFNHDMAVLLKIKTLKIRIPQNWTLQRKRYRESFHRVRNIWP